MASSVALTQRFQRGWIRGVPARIVPLNAKFSSTNFFGRAGAAASNRCQRRYVFHVAIGTDLTSLSAARKKSGCQTLIETSAGTDCSRKNAAHSRLGVDRENASRLMG